MMVLGGLEALFARSLGSDYESFLKGLDYRELIDFFEKKEAAPLGLLGEVMSNMLMASVRYDPKKGLEHQGNWPKGRDALYGVEVKQFVRDFCNIEDRHTVFFDTEAEYREWRDSVETFAFEANVSLRFKAYTWDLGPELIESY